MEKIEIIMQIISWGLAIITSLIAILQRIKAFKTEKALNTANQIKSELEQLQIITEKVQEYATEAEVNGGTGEEKKSFVLKSIKQICEQYNIPYDELLIENLLENLINITKKINSK